MKRDNRINIKIKIIQFILYISCITIDSIITDAVSFKKKTTLIYIKFIPRDVSRIRSKNRLTPSLFEARHFHRDILV